jgi:hypothetical protein
MFENANKITENRLCVGLANASHLENDMKIKGRSGRSHLSRPTWPILIRKFSNMKIYGNASVLTATNRPNMFVIAENVCGLF